MSTKLEQLQPKKQLLFGLCLTERIIHFYKEFDEVWEESFSKIANNALEELYIDLKKDNFSVYEKFSKIILSIIPDSEEYEDQEALFAQNAGISLLNCIEFSKEPDLNKIIECISKIEETLNVREIVVYNNSDIESDKLINKERILQNELINILNELPEKLTEKEINTVRTFAKENSIEIKYEY